MKEKTEERGGSLMFWEKHYKHHKLFFKTSIRVYCAILRIDTENNKFDLDVFIGEPYFSDGTIKYAEEAYSIGGWKGVELTNPKKVRECAEETIRDYELPERTANYLKLNNHFFDLRKEDEIPKYQEPEKPEIHDHEEKQERSYIQYLIENPHEVEELTAEEQTELFKKSEKLKQTFMEWFWLTRQAK
ncbi:hypothetical protein ACFO25_09830 [Paenactinomyces guangxiensis]|uniref:Uncharacterized protein n=1 Tax=Paenactinomyces guangxiensis TaxID=1490290 RepID=A0A7W1WS63_9BACL|nr:hypothetical protein [Paenactinomyces guangxiensis]MBA4495083.1 hypothetical protein [Paenactinomyces guangxiensis]MBH8592233.1 hypothetical protein [Paenactinomyces guangxiensis]